MGTTIVPGVRLKSLGPRPRSAKDLDLDGTRPSRRRKKPLFFKYLYGD